MVEREEANKATVLAYDRGMSEGSTQADNF